MVTNSSGESEQTARNHIRQNPEMYVGGVDRAGLHQLAFEALNHAVNAALSNHCDEIHIALRDNNELCIRDNSNGIYTDVHEEAGKSFLEIFMTDVGFHLNQKDKKLLKYKVEGGLHGVGLAAINPLCQSMRVESMYRNILYEQSYHRGMPINDVTAVRRLEKGESTGTIITLQPDHTIFEPADLDYEVLAARAYELSVLIPGLQIHLIDERLHQHQAQVFYDENGFDTYIEWLNSVHRVLHEPAIGHQEIQLSVSGSQSFKVIVDLAVQYTDSVDTRLYTYVNTVPVEGGIHNRAVYSALTDRINEIAQEYGLLGGQPEFIPGEIAPGLSALINIKHPEPEYRGTANRYICNPELYGAVGCAVYQADFTNEVFQLIVDKFLRNRA